MFACSFKYLFVWSLCLRNYRTIVKLLCYQRILKNKYMTLLVTKRGNCMMLLEILNYVMVVGDHLAIALL